MNKKNNFIDLLKNTVINGYLNNNDPKLRRYSKENFKEYIKYCVNITILLKHIH